MSNLFNHLRACSLLAGALMIAATTAVAAPPKESAPPKGTPYNLAVSVAAPGAVRAQLEVLVPDLKSTFKYELAEKAGGITGGIYIPPGKERRVSITAFDERGEPVYQGKGYADVDEKLTREITIELSGKETKDPSQLKLGTYRLEIGFGVNAADGYLLQATVLDAYGNHIPFKPDDIEFGDGFPFELPPYSCFRESLCIELPEPTLNQRLIFACLKDLTCWGATPKDMRGQYVQVAVGLNHTCALTSTNDIRCWGDNQKGQLGATGVWCPQALGLECSTTPLPVVCPAGEVCKFRAVAAGGNHTCAIDTAGKAWCWGEEGNNATGAAVNEDPDGRSIQLRHIPAFTDLGGKVDFVAIDTDRTHTCALSAANDVYCWGDNTFRQLGSDIGARSTARATLVRSGSKYASISTGMNHTCAMQTNRALDCWGDNFDFQLASSLPGAGLNGFNMFATLNNRVPLLGGKSVYKVAAGATSTCAENYNADTICWGSAQHFTPPNNATAGFVALHYSYARSMATERDSCAGGSGNCTRTCVVGLGPDLFCGNWTAAIPPQLPVVPDPASDQYVVWNQVDVGENHVCAVTSNRDVWCFGINKFGQFGTGAFSTARTWSPVTAAIR